MGRLDIIYKRVDELIPYVNNPRHNDQAVDAVASSIKNFGFKVPIIVDAGNEIVAGHTRLKAAKKLGLEEVPVIIADDLDEGQVRAFRLADNKTAEFSEWDFSALEIELEGLDGLFTGFEPQEIAEIFGIEGDAIDDGYEVEIPEEPTAKRGDIYQLGRHRVMCGDSTSVGDVDALMQGVSADLIQTDPPYNVDYGSKNGREILNDSLREDDFYSFLDSAFHNLVRVLKPGGAFYIWHGALAVYEFEAAMRNNGMETRQQLIWNKNSIVLSRQDYHWKHEACLYGWKGGAAHYFIDDRTQSTVIEDARPNFRKMRKDELVGLLEELYSDKISTTVMSEDRPAVSAEHPTMKPVKLLGRQIKNSSRRGEVVVDLFGGSGSTVIACEQLDRECRTMELDPKYVDVIIDRWETFTGQTAELIESRGDNG